MTKCIVHDIERTSVTKDINELIITMWHETLESHVDVIVKDSQDPVQTEIYVVFQLSFANNTDVLEVVRPHALQGPCL